MNTSAVLKPQEARELRDASASRWRQTPLWNGRCMEELSPASQYCFFIAMIMGKPLSELGTPQLANEGDGATNHEKTVENVGKVAGIALGGVLGYYAWKWLNQEGGKRAHQEERILLIWGMIDRIGVENFAKLPRRQLEKLTKPHVDEFPDFFTVCYLLPTREKDEMKVAFVIRFEDSKHKKGKGWTTLRIALNDTKNELNAIPAVESGSGCCNSFFRVDRVTYNVYHRLLALIEEAANRQLNQPQ